MIDFSVSLITLGFQGACKCLQAYSTSFFLSWSEIFHPLLREVRKSQTIEYSFLLLVSSPLLKRVHRPSVFSHSTMLMLVLPRKSPKYKRDKMSKRQDNTIRNDTENIITNFVIQRHMQGLPGLPPSRFNPSNVSLAKLSRQTGISIYRLGLITSRIELLAERYGIGPCKNVVHHRSPQNPKIAKQRSSEPKITNCKFYLPGMIEQHFGDRPLPARSRVITILDIKKSEIDSPEFREEISRLYKRNGREWGVRDTDGEQQALAAYKHRLDESGKKIPKLLGNRAFDRGEISIRTGIPIGRLRSVDIKNQLKQLDIPEKRATADEINKAVDTLASFVDLKIRSGVRIPVHGRGFDLTKIAHEVGIPPFRLHNIDRMRVLIRLWASSCH